MCGIFGCICSKAIRGQDKIQIREQFNRIKHRGPDQSIERYYDHNVMFGFHRLQIVDPTSDAMQPFDSQDFICMVNGEIFNYKQLETQVDGYQAQSNSDCEVVVHLFQQLYNQEHNMTDATKKLCNMLDGEFAIAIWHKTIHQLVLAVDELRVRPLFWLFNQQDKTLWFSSEQKALINAQTDNNIIRVVRASSFVFFDDPTNGEAATHWYYQPLKPMTNINDYPWYSQLSIDDKTVPHKLRELLLANMKKKLVQGDRDIGFLLSGGLDSSLVCAMASRIIAPARIRTFTVGFSEDAPDVIAAKKVAKHINSIHTTYIVTIEEALSEIPDVIWYGETWDQTSIRASAPMRLCLKHMKQDHPEIAVVFSGEVADELLRGYLYNLLSPTPEEGMKDIVKRLQDITYFDGLRADRMVSSVSSELRLPFFSRDLLDFVFSLDPLWLDPKYHNGVEKWLLRQAFNVDENGELLNYLPQDLLFRVKHAFSDATSKKSTWKIHLKQQAEKEITESRFKAKDQIYDKKKTFIQTREDMWYRELFDQFGFDECVIPYKWMPSWCDKDLTDSSATALSVFHES